eukprot:SAG11_NODE_1414_length_4978_cov_31.434720_1_plen_34_part_00
MKFGGGGRLRNLGWEPESVLEREEAGEAVVDEF